MFSHLQNKKFAAAQAESLRNLSLSVASRKANEKESCCCFLATASSLLQLLQKGYSIYRERSICKHFLSLWMLIILQWNFNVTKNCHDFRGCRILKTA